MWLKQAPTRKALVVCPKAIVEKWQRELKEYEVKATVVSRDGVKKIDLKKYNTLILDEAQDFASPLFNDQRSARSTAIYNFIKSHKYANVLLLTATPVRSTPWNIHTLACFLGIFWPLREFRDEFFYFTDMFGRWHWEKKIGWQKAIRSKVEEISDIVLMKDCVDVPVQSEQVVHVPWTKNDENFLSHEYAEPSKEWHTWHRAENGRNKFVALMGILDGYRKAIVVCHYTQQIEDYVNWIGDDRQVFVLQGSTPDQDAVIQAAKEADDCIFIIQASMGAGFDAAEFSVVVFASMSFKYVDLVQMKGRVKRINNLHSNLFIYLLGGKCDNAVFSALQKGKDFDVHQELIKR